MPWIGAVVGAAGGLIGNAMSASGASSTNQRQINADFQMQQNAFNFDDAEMQKAMAYDTEMSNTAYSRGVAGMKAAGLNPMLAVGNPASSPQISAPQGPGGSVGSLTNPQASMANLGQLGQSAMSTYNQTAAQEAATANVNADTATKIAKLPYSAQQAAQELQNAKETQAAIHAQALQAFQDWDITQNNFPYQLKQLQSNTDFVSAMNTLKTQQAQVDLQMSRLGMPSAENAAAFQDSWIGKALNYLGFGPGGGMGSAIGTAARAALLGPEIGAAQRVGTILGPRALNTATGQYNPGK